MALRASDSSNGAAAAQFLRQLQRRNDIQARRRARKDSFLLGQAPGVGIHTQHLLYRFRCARRSFTDHHFNYARNAGEADSAFRESGHGHLVGGDRELHVRPWLYAVARNRCLSMLRARLYEIELKKREEKAAAERAAMGRQ